MMSNIVNIQTLHYCNKKTSYTGTCRNIATRQIETKRKKDNTANAIQTGGYRCEEHAMSGTANMVVVKSLPFDQSFALTKISQYLHSIVNKNIISKFHTAKQLRVKYVKLNTGGVMCFQEYSKQWKFVYYHQIEKVI